MNEHEQGVILVLLGSIAFSIGGLLVKLLPWSALSINGGRCFFSSVVIYTYIRLSKHELRFNKTTILGGICVILMMICYVSANKLTTAANTIVLEYTAPILVIIFEALIFKRPIRKLDIGVCLLVFAGIAIVMIDGLAAGNTLGDLIALASGVFYALTIMLNEFKDGDSLTSILIGHTATVFIGLPFILQETDFSLQTLGLLAALGIFQAGAGYTLLAIGTKKCDAISASLAASVEPVLNPILVALFYGEYISGRAFIGALIVIVSITVYNVLNKK